MERNNLLQPIVIFIASAFFILGCSDKTIFDSSYEVDELAWDFNKTLSYNIPIEDSLQPYDLMLNLKYRKTYPYRNIYFFVDVEAPSKTNYRDTIECILETPLGYSLGKVADDEVELELMYRYNIHFPEIGLYNIRIQHAMRDTLLKGIKSVGVKLRKHIEEN